jgi:hypothetical protein
MLKLAARHADIWNVVGAPDVASEANRRLDAICAEAGRDPATLVRSVSPGINLLASVDAFVEGVAAYHAAGFRDIYLPWPRTEAEVPVLRKVARSVIPGLRGAPSDATPPGRHPLRPLAASDLPALREKLAGLGDGPSRQVLDDLIAHAGETRDGDAIQAALGFASHAEVTRAIAALGDEFSGMDLARPWTEAQRGYTLPPDAAEILRAALP